MLVDSLARRLAPGRPVTILLCSPGLPEVQPREGIEIVQVVIDELDFMARSRAAGEALARIARPGDRVEFQDFEGLGYFAFANRSGLGLERVVMTVRFHGPFGLLAEGMDTAQDDWDIPIAMEREVFGMADQVLIPVAGHRETLIERYGVEPERIVVAPPPVDPLPRIASRAGDRPTFAVVGRLAEVKGSQDIVAAALDLLEEGLDVGLRFVGGDGWSPTTGTTMSERLRSMIPDQHASAFEFREPVDRSRLPEVLEDVTAVVVPSRFESFCLAAHEARSMGLPVIVVDLPAFRGVLDPGTGALVVEPSVAGLAAGMRRLATDPDLVAELASAPTPILDDPMLPYLEDPEPRHPRSQAGLATAATQRLEALLASKEPRPPLLRRILQSLPEPVTAVLRRAPRSIKDRVKSASGWDEDETWRYRREAELARQDRLAAVTRRIRAGEFPDVPDPDVTVVIPVHDDVDYLDETLASIYEQTHTSWEVVVVDDGSSDPKAVAYLDSLRRRPRLRLVRQENRGLPAARNAGMKIARGRFFVPLDADDQLEPEFMAHMLAALESRPDAAYAHCYARLHHDVDAVWVTRPFNPYWQLLGNGVVGCVLLRREAWEQVGGYDETMTLGNEDWEMWLRLMANGWDQVHVREVLFKYRKHGISMSVRTEARFEEGRRMVRDRHPELYSQESMRRSKTVWYPLITIVSDSAPPGDPDVEVVGAEEDLETTWGKFVVDLRGIEPIPLGTILEMAALLEADPGARIVSNRGSPPITMIRRWALHDPDSGHESALIHGSDLPGPETSLHGFVPRAGWSVPGEIEEPNIPVQRQPPEEAGLIPDVTKW